MPTVDQTAHRYFKKLAVRSTLPLSSFAGFHEKASTLECAKIVSAPMVMVEAGEVAEIESGEKGPQGEGALRLRLQPSIADEHIACSLSVNLPDGTTMETTSNVDQSVLFATKPITAAPGRLYLLAAKAVKQE